uniref:protein xylosyltransferase n=1 Tax=Anopheles funestus TaxID=62324 RepID=A0A4Y0BMI5_ANOFN
MLTISNGTKYVLPCEVSDPTAIDAITRAASDECKIKIANAACKISQGKLTPKSIVNHCPRGGFVPYRPLGCYPARNLKYNITLTTLPDNTPKNCVDFCTQRHFRYALVQNGDICYCEDEKPNPKEKRNDLMCNKPCPKNPKLFCGGTLEAFMYETGLAKHPMLPIKLHPSPQDKPVRIAFLLMFYKRNLRQIHRLIRAIYDKNHYYYIHVDPRQQYLYRELLKLEKDFPNIYVTRQRHNITWGCFTQLQALLACLKHILTMPSWEADFILNLSESDFPIRSIGKLTQFLTANRGRNFVQMQSVVTLHKFIKESGYVKNFLECENRMWLIGDRQPLSGIVTNGGSDWFCLSREFVKYALDERNDLVADVMRIMEHTIFGTENFFHQVLQNSHLCQTHYDSGLRLISWSRGHGCSKSRTVEWAGCSPLTLHRVNWPSIESSITDVIYAIRKVNPIFDQTIILTLEEYAFGRYPSNVPNLNAYWENVYHHEDEKHHTRMNAVLNVAFLLLHINAQENNLERYEILKILEITHYFNRNLFEGFLIRHFALVDDTQLELEVFVKPINKYSPCTKLKGKLSDVTLTISNVIDVVEQTALDFDRVLSADMQPMLIFHLPRDQTLSKSTINHTVTVDWIDPHQQSVVVENYTIGEDRNKINYHSLQSTTLTIPLEQGIWRAKAALNGTYIGMIDFLIVSNVPIVLPRSSATSSVCSRPRGVFVQDEKFTCAMKSSDYVLHKNALLSASVKHLFHLESTCIIDRETTKEHINFKPFVNCSETMWSTLAPDPKSDVYNPIKKRN